MHLNEHILQSFQTFGKAYEEVHIWLDEFAGTPQYGYKHRRVRHHLAGIQEAGRLFGIEAMKAARQHIIADLKMEGWKDSDHFPEDEADYVKMGLY